MAYLNHYRGNSAHRPQEVLLAQFSLYVHKGGLYNFHFSSFHLARWLLTFLVGHYCSKMLTFLISNYYCFPSRDRAAWQSCVTELRDRAAWQSCGTKLSSSATLCQTIVFILALMLLAFTTRRMVRSAHLARSHFCFTAQFDFAISNRYS